MLHTLHLHVTYGVDIQSLDNMLRSLPTHSLPTSARLTAGRLQPAKRLVSPNFAIATLTVKVIVLEACCVLRAGAAWGPFLFIADIVNSGNVISICHWPTKAFFPAVADVRLSHSCRLANPASAHLAISPEAISYMARLSFIMYCYCQVAVILRRVQ